MTSMPIDEVTLLLRTVGAAFGLGEQLLDYARQTHPVLRTEDPGPLDEVAKARADAVAGK